MKLFYVSTILVISGCAMNLEIDEETYMICKALKNIIQLGVLTPPLNVQSKDQNLVNCIKSRNLTYFVNLRTNSTRSISKSSLLIVENKEDITNLLHLLNYNNNHLVVARKILSGDLNELVDLFWKNLLMNVSFLVIENSNIVMQTFIPYNENKCNDTELKTINWFDKTTEMWQMDNFFPNKLNNFHRCSVKIATHPNIIPYIVREEYVNGQRVLKGRVIQMIYALAQSLNFTPELDYEPSFAAFDNCYRKVASNEADLYIGNVALDSSRIDSMDFSLPIFFEFLKFVIPPGKYYTQVENFARVFDTLTWILIFVVFLLVGGLVLILSFRSRQTKILAFGARYRNAVMDFIATIFGTSTTSLPDLNVSRLIILKFVIFCFVIRTLYQGSLYNFLQSGAQANTVQSINEMISKGFTFFMLKGYSNYLNLSTHTQTSKKIIQLADFDEILEKISDTEFKGTLLHTSSLISYKNELKKRNFTSLFCKEYLMTVSMVAYLRKNFYLTEIVNDKIGIFHAAGLIDAWDKRSKITLTKSVEVQDDRKPLSFTKLRGVFVVYLYACGVSILCCVAEIVFNYINNLLTERSAATKKKNVRFGKHKKLIF